MNTPIASESRKPVKLAFDLQDGSCLIGVPEIDKLPFQSTLGLMTVSLSAIERVEFSPDRQSETLFLNNGDKITGKVQLQKIVVRTLIGKVEVALEYITRIGAVQEGRVPETLLKKTVLYFSFDTDEGGKVSDRSGKGNNGVVYGAKWVRNGKSGGAFEFDGNDDYIRIKINDSLKFGRGNFSMSVWVKMLGGSRQGCAIGTNWQPNGDTQLIFRPGGRLEFIVSTSWEKKGQANTSVEVADGQWHHWVGVRDAENGKVRLYIDGKKVSESDDTSETIDSTVDWAVGTLIGPDNQPYPSLNTQFLRGMIDEVMIFNCALDDTEVKTLYESHK